jgi:meso-butanediol dehydrogenase / (S,S)-butanediol dehydrogenase / diacetyl reductase
MANGRLQGKVALVSGAGGGQGRAVALRFAREGALVVATDIDAPTCEETARLAREAGLTLSILAPCDLSREEEAERWIAFALERHGRIDILYNNASAMRLGGPEQASADWQFTMRSEIDLYFYCAKYAWPHFPAGGGVIINVASVNGYTALPEYLGHCTAKAGVLGMTRGMAADGRARGIRVVSISPGPIETPGSARHFAIPGVREKLLGQLLVDRLGQPDDVANAAVFLASDEAAFITGTDLTVDGGLTAWLGS